jgi:HK97 gp10 family phage protein
MAVLGGTVIVFNRIPALLAAVEANSRAAVKATADKIRDDAKARVPVDTGFLRDSIVSESVTAGKEAEVWVWADYGIHVEFGTYKMAARPFLTPAVEAHVDEFADAIGRGVTL